MLVGPGANQQLEEAPKPTLEGASEFEFVTILNPLPDDFAIQVAQDIPVNMPFVVKDQDENTLSESDVMRTYGVGLRNKDFKGRKHVSNTVIVKAGQTINLKGNEAQVGVRQLVNEILQREGKRRLMSDPHLRREVEDRIIRKRGSVQELLDRGLQSQRSQIDEAIKQSNEAQNEEVAFPGLNQADRSSRTEPVDSKNDGSSQPKRVGRPKKANS